MKFDLYLVEVGFAYLFIQLFVTNIWTITVSYICMILNSELDILWKRKKVIWTSLRHSPVMCLVGVKVKWSRYRPGVAQRVGRGIALLFHDRGTGRGLVFSSTSWPHFTPGKDAIPTLQEAGWAPEPVWTGGKSRPYRDSIPDRPVRSLSLYQLSYRAHYLPGRSKKKIKDGKL